MDDAFDNAVEQFPSVTYPDIMNYLIFSASSFTSEKLKAYKCLEAYKQVTEGCVRRL